MCLALVRYAIELLLNESFIINKIITVIIQCKWERVLAISKLLNIILNDVFVHAKQIEHLLDEGL